MKNGTKKLLSVLLAALMSVSSMATFAAAEEYTEALPVYQDPIELFGFTLEANTGIVIPLGKSNFELGIAFRNPYPTEEECIAIVNYAKEYGDEYGYAYFEVEEDTRTLILNNFKFDFVEYFFGEYLDDGTITDDELSEILKVSADLNSSTPALCDFSGEPLIIESTGTSNTLGMFMYGIASTSDLTITGNAPLNINVGIPEEIIEKMWNATTSSDMLPTIQLMLYAATQGIVLSGYGADLDISANTSVNITSGGIGITTGMNTGSSPRSTVKSPAVLPVIPVEPIDMTTDITINGKLNIDAAFAGIMDASISYDNTGMIFNSADVTINSDFIGIYTSGTTAFLDSKVSVTTEDGGILELYNKFITSNQESPEVYSGTVTSVEDIFKNFGAITASDVSITGGEMTVDSFLNGISAVKALNTDSTPELLSETEEETEGTEEETSPAFKISVESADLTINSTLYAMCAENGITLSDCYISDPEDAVLDSDGTLHILTTADGQPIANVKILSGAPKATEEDTTSPVPNLNLTGIRYIENGKTKLLPSAFGSRRTFKFTPAEGYCVADVLVNGKSVGAVEKYTVVTVPGITVEVIYEEIEG